MQICLKAIRSPTNIGEFVLNGNLVKMGPNLLSQDSTIPISSHYLLVSKETFFTRQQKYVTCQINKDTNSYYITSIGIYLCIIINPLNETEHA
jgi:hypothetical protein